jgi:hypothetical protein
MMALKWEELINQAVDAWFDLYVDDLRSEMNMTSSTKPQESILKEIDDIERMDWFVIKQKVRDQVHEILSDEV